MGETLKMERLMLVPYGSGTGDGFFRTLIFLQGPGATSANGLTRRALTVQNLMEQVKARYISSREKAHYFSSREKKNIL